MVDWFWDPVEEEASAEATREEHAEPEVWKLVWDAQDSKAPFPPPQVGQPALAAILEQFWTWKIVIHSKSITAMCAMCMPQK